MIRMLTGLIQAPIERVTHAVYQKDDQLVKRALKCLESRVKYSSDKLTGPYDVRNYIRLKLANELNEVFTVLFLDNHHRVLACEKLFTGTINSATVHPRVIAQRAFYHNAAAVILAHNHPSGEVNPSNADQYITQLLKQTLNALDIRVLDHFIVSHEYTYSFLEHGLI